MFWRRKTSNASGSGSTNSNSKRQKQSGDSGGDDEIAQLQRQFGIKPVSDADVQAEFRSLFGAGAAATGASGLSPRSELLLFGASAGANGDDDDDEANILRALNIHGTSVDKIDVDALDLSDDDDDNTTNDGGAAKRELTDVLRDVHATAMQNQNQNDPMQIATNTQSTRGARSHDDDVAARVRALKLEAIALRREGNVKEALALFRRAKELEAQVGAAAPIHLAPVAPPAAVAARTTSQQPLKAPAAVDTSAMDVDDADVQVTDEDMKDPAFLAQLAALGLAPDDGDDNASPPVDTVASLTAELQDAKLRAVRHKRHNEIQDALQCMRHVKDLEAKLAALTGSATGTVTATHASVSAVVTTTTTTAVAHSLSSASQPADATVIDRQTRSSAVEVVHAYTSAATTPGDDDDDEDEGVDVTDTDMNDPAFAAELAKLGFAPSASDSNVSQQATLDDAQSAKTRLERARTLESAGGSSGRALQSALSVGDEDLIDAFEDSDDEDEDAGARSAVAASCGYGVLAAEAVPSVPLPPVTAAPPDSRAIADLQAQLQLTKETAVRLKRSGDIQGALGAMRRVKQIESLLAHKQQVAAIGLSALALPPVHDPATQAQFHALEQLLVDFGNRALALAKEQLSLDRAKATEWLNKRKEYASALDELHEKRKNPLQAPPPYRIEHLMRQVDVELMDVPADHVVVTIHGVNDLRAAAGRDVFVRFCLNFPAATPHEGKTSTVRVSSTPPHSTGKTSRPHQFQFPVQRSRGTQRLFEIKKAQFEVWTAGTFLRSSELLARGYQELTPFLSTCQVHTRVPFVGSNRKPTGGDVEVSIRFRTPLRDKETRTEIVEELHVGAYPEPSVPVVTAFTPPVVVTPPPPPPPAASVPSAVAVSSRVQSVEPPPVDNSVVSSSEPTDDEMDDPHHPDLVISYDVINEEIAKIEAKLPTLQGSVAMELRDRLDSLALKKQLLEIDMETGKLTLEMYVAKLHARIQADRQLMAKLMRASRRLDAARVLHRVKTMEKELVGTDDSTGADSDAAAPM